jgi:hypothetical protein
MNEKSDIRSLIDQIIIKSRNYDGADSHVVDISSIIFDQIKIHYPEITSGAIYFTIHTHQIYYDLLLKRNELLPPGTISVTSIINKEPKLIEL